MRNAAIPSMRRSERLPLLAFAPGGEFLARVRLDAQQRPERDYSVEVAVRLHNRSKMSLIYESRSDGYPIPMRNAPDLLFYLVDDVPAYFPLALHFHHAH